MADLGCQGCQSVNDDSAPTTSIVQSLNRQFDIILLVEACIEMSVVFDSVRYLVSSDIDGLKPKIAI
jgi:hypothetical protein